MLGSSGFTCLLDNESGLVVHSAVVQGCIAQSFNHRRQMSTSQTDFLCATHCCALSYATTRAASQPKDNVQRRVLQCYGSLLHALEDA